MPAHLINGEFQSDKYPTTPRGKVPLSCEDPTAQDLLWEYAQRRRMVDAEFSEDLETALRSAGYTGYLQELKACDIAARSIADAIRKADSDWKPSAEWEALVSGLIDAAYRVSRPAPAPDAAMVAVPREATEEMVEAGRAALSGGDKVQTHARAIWCWEAMINAATPIADDAARLRDHMIRLANGDYDSGYSAESYAQYALDPAFMPEPATTDYPVDAAALAAAGRKGE